MIPLLFFNSGVCAVLSVRTDHVVVYLLTKFNHLWF